MTDRHQADFHQVPGSLWTLKPDTVTLPFLNPIDPNPAISAHAVFPQSGHIRPCSISPIRPYPPGKTAVFPKISTFFQNGTLKKVLIAYLHPIHQIAHENLYQMHKKWFSLDKIISRYTFEFGYVSQILRKFWRNFRKTWGNTAYWMKYCGV